MSDNCCDIPTTKPGLKKVLWIALVLNCLMFFTETIYGWFAQSTALKADAVDFFGDSVNYGVSLLVLSSALSIRAKASIFKSLTMGGLGIAVLGNAIYGFIIGSTPHAETISIIGILALVTNVFVAYLLYQFREGDSNINSVWLCSRNDAIGNIAVIFAGVAVYYFRSNLPDLIVAILMSTLNISSSVKIAKRAFQELRHAH